MLKVTEAARDRLLSKLVRKKAADGEAMRFTRRDGGWRLRPDQLRRDDTTFMHKGRRVLLLDKAVAQRMAGMKLDVRDVAAGPRLKLRRTANPK